MVNAAPAQPLLTRWRVRIRRGPLATCSSSEESCFLHKTPSTEREMETTTPMRWKFTSTFRIRIRGSAYVGHARVTGNPEVELPENLAVQKYASRKVVFAQIRRDWSRVTPQRLRIAPGS